MLDSRCPYCEGDSFTVVDTVWPRHPQHTTVVCGECDAYAVQHQNGRVYPLADRTEPEAAVVNRVVD